MIVYLVRRWLLLILPVAIILAAWYIHRFRTDLRERQTQERARVTARVWVATALYSDNPERFLEYRDSLLAAHKLSVDEMHRYLERYRSRSEKYELFVTLVSQYVDSILAIESARTADSIVDSTRVADSSMH
ncbi:MAG: hypothetical protein AB1744_09565 [Candidatus Zixiibacteriota bacterium]